VRNAKQVYDFMLENFKELLKKKGVEFEIVEEQIRALKKIALWYANDERFSGDLRKGILLRGTCGTGKSIISTVIEETIKKGQLNNPMHISATRLQEIYQNNEEVEKEMLENRLFVIIDDLGTESAKITIYGSVIYPFNSMFESRYKKGLTTIVNTNYTPDDIEKAYTIRIRDRFRETMNEIVLEFKSLRK